jgi:hypothetical protein
MVERLKFQAFCSSIRVNAGGIRECMDLAINRRGVVTPDMIRQAEKAG